MERLVKKLVHQIVKHQVVTQTLVAVQMAVRMDIFGMTTKVIVIAARKNA